MAGLYLHIPFCKRICAYCDFFRTADLRPMDALLEAMHREIDARSDYLGNEPLSTIYFGGGTPSLCSPEALARLLAHAAERFGTSQVEETTLEANPDDLTPEYLADLRRIGINRLSIGIQSFDNACLRMMNRRHTAEQALLAVAEARSAGFENLSADLIFGVPGFGGTSLQRSLDQLLDLDVPHISAYHLTFEPGTAFARRAERGVLRPVDEAVSEAEYALVHETLTRAGYEHYEVSNFARPGFRAHHNAAYWKGVKYLGIGPAAHSFDGRERHWNVASVEAYIAGSPPQTEILSERDQYNEFLLTRLRTAEGIDLDELARRFGEKRRNRLLRETARWSPSGALQYSPPRIAIPPERMLVSDAVIESFFETQETSQPSES